MRQVTQDQFEFRDVLRCNACQSARQRQLGFRGGQAHRSGQGIRTRVVTCEECGLIFTNPMPVPIDPSLLYDNPAEEYFKHHDIEVKRNVTTTLLSELEERIQGRRLLDVGCGQGVLLEVARSRGWDAVGLDISEQFAKYAGQRLKVRVDVGDIATIQLLPDSFDVIILNAILEHLIDPQNVLAKIFAALRPGGLLLLDVPNEAGLYYRIGNLWQRVRRRDWVVNLSPTFSPGHLYGFSPKSLRTILVRTGFGAVSIRVYHCINCLPPPQRAEELVERLGTSAVMLIARVLGLGDGMEAVAAKTENGALLSGD